MLISLYHIIHDATDPFDGIGIGLCEGVGIFNFFFLFVLHVVDHQVRGLVQLDF